ncbi:MarR family winged helix-turn-helix transcriptional regulator [Tuwongella immobilis]|uniref:HTH marR-type domain-containing protein n=1 Tax=Tuwongella immobilis TaxID=692036 RepID=A0A6C2YQJ7_9BACT|nr:MarR family transcriptional regulator [Tuwongella immobilis]VIP03162.1 family transcriptional regulator : Transcriptional regulator, MarR family protein OS=Blastopirellula marina DSM 3645 GN=DSM3645_19383 PE=4 SV=1: MarR [Tuwongella immobilis]VTS03573.1 family transcriptional regulator : Transcriptional regulator, MarR family protein OS=Blastopirellula marina DSM 3645 GN=DSM3645_19383 PE=4 SV=1: MarR [Tuwongella immobilis]
MLEFDFEASIGYWTSAIAHAMERAMNEELASHGITYQQWQVLAWLVHDGELAQSELAERMKIEPPTLVGILDRMERNGWISREPCLVDRRKKMIRPTPRVEPIWLTMVSCAHKIRAQAASGLTPEEVQQTLQSLQKMMTNLRNARLQKESGHDAT